MDTLKSEGNVKRVLFSAANSGVIRDALSELDEVNSLLLLKMSVTAQSRLVNIASKLQNNGTHKVKRESLRKLTNMRDLIRRLGGDRENIEA